MPLLVIRLYVEPTRARGRTYGEMWKFGETIHPPLLYRCGQGSPGEIIYTQQLRLASPMPNFDLLHPGRLTIDRRIVMAGYRQVSWQGQFRHLLGVTNYMDRMATPSSGAMSISWKTVSNVG